MEPSELLTPAQAAKEMHRTIRTIHNWLEAGLPHIRRGPKRGRIYIPKQALYCDTRSWPEIQKRLLEVK